MATPQSKMTFCNSRDAILDKLNYKTLTVIKVFLTIKRHNAHKYSQLVTSIKQESKKKKAILNKYTVSSGIHSLFILSLLYSKTM